MDFIREPLELMSPIQDRAHSVKCVFLLTRETYIHNIENRWVMLNQNMDNLISGQFEVLWKPHSYLHNATLPTLFKYQLIGKKITWCYFSGLSGRYLYNNICTHLAGEDEVVPG